MFPKPRPARNVSTEPAAMAVRVLAEDPDLGAGIAGNEWDMAVASAVAPLYVFDRGTFDFRPPPDPGGLGALVLAGMIVVQIDTGTRAHLELLGEGDVISPWVSLGEELAIPSVLNALVVQRLRIALLNRRFTARTARWPEIHAALMHRLVVRTRRLSLQSAINGISRVEERLELTLWELANRFGRVTSEGITLELPITHAQLAEMLGAQRPSVSTAIGRLQADGRVVRRDRHSWLLPGEPPPVFSSLALQTGLRA